MPRLRQRGKVITWASGMVLSVACGVELPLLVGAPGRSAIQGEAEIPPDAAPAIAQVQPNQAPAGDELSVRVDGQGFSRGVYVSFSTPTVHVVSTRRLSATGLEVRLAIAPLAQPGAFHLYVSNPAGAVAETPFTITPAKPVPKPPSPPDQTPEPGTPEVASVNPSRVGLGSHVTLKITGRNFASGAKVAFSNPGIRVLETNVSKPTELAATIEVAKGASPGKTSLFVVNPGDVEVEVPFEVVGEGSPSPGGEAGGGQVQHFEVFNLGDVSSILQSANKPKGTLTVGGGKLRYEENGKEVFSAATHDVQEIDANAFFGVNTGTFHVILRSGKRFNFVPSSLRPADTDSLVNTLRQALHSPTRQ